LFIETKLIDVQRRKEFSVNSSKYQYIKALGNNENPEVNLLCFPCAGGSAMTYRDWPVVPETCAKFAVELPGRGSNRRKPPLRTMQRVIDSLMRESAIFSNMPTIFYGHSMGAWVAYELARALNKTKQQLPQHIIISGSLPIILNRLPPFVHKMSIEQLRDELRILGGTPDDVLADVEMLSIFSESIQADFEIFETHTHTHRTPLNVDVSLWAAMDDPRIPISVIPLWKQLFSGTTKEYYFSGGHMFYDKNSNRKQTNNLISTEIENLKRFINLNGGNDAHLRLAS